MSKNTEKKRPSFLRRWFLGNNHPSNVMDVEEIVSPTKQVLRNFAERKLAVFALFVVIAMFIFVFVAPLFMPKYYDAYSKIYHFSNKNTNRSVFWSNFMHPTPMLTINPCAPSTSEFRVSS